jgi:hypothetical protein
LGLSSSSISGISLVGPDDYQLWQVLALPVATSGELGVLQHILGLALSMDFGGTGAVSPGNVNTVYLRQVWLNYKQTGGYKLPLSSIDWTEAQLIDWLKRMQFNIPF